MIGWLNSIGRTVVVIIYLTLKPPEPSMFSYIVYSCNVSGDLRVNFAYSQNLLKERIRVSIWFLCGLCYIKTLSLLLYRMLQTDTAVIQEQLRILTEKNLIKEMEPGKWVRKVLDQKTGKSCLRI